MFETVVPETFEVRSKRVLYETLPLSIAVHVLALSGLALMTLWNIGFPVDSPRVVRAYSLVAIPDPVPDVAAIAPGPTAVEAPQDPGIPGGAIDGKINGEVGGKLHGLASQFFPQDGRVHIERNQSLPLKVVEQEYPVYPDKAKKD